jgi:hypothetical protein
VQPGVVFWLFERKSPDEIEAEQKTCYDALISTFGEVVTYLSDAWRGIVDGMLRCGKILPEKTDSTHVRLAHKMARMAELEKAELSSKQKLFPPKLSLDGSKLLLTQPPPASK